MEPRDYYVEYVIGDVKYRQGPWAFVDAWEQRNDIEGYEGVSGANVVHIDQLDPQAQQLG